MPSHTELLFNHTCSLLRTQLNEIESNLTLAVHQGQSLHGIETKLYHLQEKITYTHTLYESKRYKIPLFTQHITEIENKYKGLCIAVTVLLEQELNTELHYF